MRVFVFFDLPTTTLDDRREYTKFRKHLINSGFLMLQESVYTKLVLNDHVGDRVVADLELNKPKSGSVAVLRVTETQFAKMKFICGSFETNVINTPDRLVIL